MRRAATLPEVLIAIALVALVAGGIAQLASFLVGSKRTSAVRLTGASFLRQDLRLALEKLIDRVEHGIEILEPAPGASGGALVFRDLLNHTIRLDLDRSRTLVTSRVTGATAVPEKSGVQLTTASGAAFTPAAAVRIPNCERAAFHVASPGHVLIELTLAETGGSVTMVAGVRLRCGRGLDE